MSNDKGIHKLDNKGRKACSFSYDEKQYGKVKHFCEVHHTTFTLLMRKLLDDFCRSKGF